MSNKKRKESVTRAQFVRRLMDECDFGYRDAARAYDCMIGIFEDAVVSIKRINLGHVGALTPKEVNPKAVAMNFKRENDMIVPTRRDFYVGKRVKFNLNLYQSFLARAKLNWF